MRGGDAVAEQRRGEVGRRELLGRGLLAGLALAAAAPTDRAAADGPPVAGELPAAQAVAVAEVAPLAGGVASSATDGLTLASGDRILLAGQSDPTENGPWVVADGAWSRPVEFPSGASVGSCTMLVGGGAEYAGTYWVLALAAPVVVDAGAQPWQLLRIAGAQLPSSVVTSSYSAQPVTLTAADGGHSALKLKTSGADGVFSTVALDIEAYGGGLIITQTADFAALNATAGDAIDIFLKSTGDGVCVYHQGGKPPGYTGISGGNAGFNCFIPYNIDDLTTGRSGSVVNDRSGMVGLLIANQAVSNRGPSIYVEHYANSPALQIVNQYSAYPNAGTADAVSIWDNGSFSAIQVHKQTAPATGHAAINASTSLAGPIDLFRGNDSGGLGRFLVRSDGAVALGLPYPGYPVGAVRLHVNMSANGVQRTLALSNGGSSGNHDGDGVQIEFDGGAAQFALITAVFESLAPRNASLRFSVDAGGSMTERLRLDARGIGFFGKAPVARQTMGSATAAASYGANEQAMLQAVYNALRNLGLGT